MINKLKIKKQINIINFSKNKQLSNIIINLEIHQKVKKN